MSDNITGTDFSGSSVTLGTKEVAGAHLGKQVLSDPATGEPQDIGLLLQEIALRLSDIADSVGNLSPDTAGRIRVSADVVATHAVTLASLATVTTVTTLTNQAQAGGFAMNAYIATISQLAEGNLRRNVVIS